MTKKERKILYQSGMRALTKKKLRLYVALFSLAIFSATLVRYALHVHGNPAASSAHSLSASLLSKEARAWTSHKNSAKQGHDAVFCFLCNFLQGLAGEGFVAIEGRPALALLGGSVALSSIGIPSLSTLGAMSPRAPPALS